MDGVVHTYKARLVAKGFTQTYGLDYEETFSSVADIRAIRFLIALATFYDYEIWQMNVKISFLNGHLSEEVYMVQHEGDIIRELKVSFYTDVRYQTDDDDIKSHTGYVFVLNGGDVDWKSTKQIIFATSFVSKEDARKSIFKIGVVPTIEEPIKMYCDNTRAITIANESGITKGARHYRAKVHYLREVVEFGDIKLEKVHTDDNLFDPFTKVLPFPKHSEHTKYIGMLTASSLM
nr:hypothetical protein [Tanacetum cinerariifolium]